MALIGLSALSAVLCSCVLFFSKWLSVVYHL